ncbi:hypothetical protein [Ciceribacter sp. L1K22]|uniref:hypothetical protein n=1 Tax=Ciceribacter sp. L1K22 TaxID=2820275 RepID=UPI001ABE5BF3|nr:hypothetical protein [Ciceribacter sp. L1K22]MBO3761431.1 hypothetical protein [Ciceribacter sp. L1K22]
MNLPEKAIVAMAYLLSRGLRTISRAALAEFLWDENEQADSLANLRQMLARTRQRQGSGTASLFAADGPDIRLNAEGLDCDLLEFEAVDHSDPINALRNYLLIVKGPFLDGCRMNSMACNLWVEAERSTQIKKMTAALAAALARSDAQTHATLLRDAGNHVLALDRHNEEAFQALLSLYALTGQHNQARVLTAQYQDRLRRDLDLPVRAAAVSAVTPTVRAQDEHLPRPMRPPGSLANLPRVLLVPPGPVADIDGRLAGALVDDVTIGLCRARSVSVVASHTARRVALQGEPTAELYRKHNVAYALETRLGSGRDAAMLFASLTDVENDHLVWAERFDLSAGQLSRSYRDIVQRIVSATADQVEQQEFRKIRFVAAPDAYQHYLLGQYHLKKIDLPNLRRAKRSFRSALNEAPTLSSAFSGLSRTEHLEWLVTARGDGDLLRSAEHHALDAIRTDAGNAGGYHQLGVVKLYHSAFDESLEVFEEAEHIAPSHADLIADYADTLVHASEPDRALEKIECAIDLNPLCPDVYWWTAAGANYCLERYETALSCIDRMEDSSAITRLAAACWAMLGDQKKARALMRRTMEFYPDFEVEKWLSIMPVKENWQREQYREGLKRAGFQ